jgi:hypothetical protein
MAGHTDKPVRARTAAGSSCGRTLEARLRAVEDHLEIMGLEAEYAVAWDLCEAQRWADVFTGDGVFEMLPAGERPGMRIAGRAALRRFCAETTARWTGMHLMHNPKITIDGDSARGTVFFEYKHVMRATTEHTIQGTVTGYYEIRYRRTRDGWRMQERIEKAVAAATASFYDFGR